MTDRDSRTFLLNLRRSGSAGGVQIVLRDAWLQDRLVFSDFESLVAYLQEAAEPPGETDTEGKNT